MLCDVRSDEFDTLAAVAIESGEVVEKYTTLSAFSLVVQETIAVVEPVGTAESAVMTGATVSATTFVVMNDPCAESVMFAEASVAAITK